MRWGERHFIQEMDDTGVLTRGGTRISWNEFKALERWQTKMSAYGKPLSDEYLLKSPKGKVSLPLWRTKNAKEARKYLIGHLPPNVLESIGNSSALRRRAPHPRGLHRDVICHTRTLRRLQKPMPAPRSSVLDLVFSEFH